METILKLLQENLVMVFAFLVPMVLLRLADICFGVVLSFKQVNLHFDWKKLLNGLFWTLITVMGIACLTCGVVILPALLDIYKITFVDTEVLATMVNVLTFLAIIIKSTMTYGKDAATKFAKITGHEDMNEIPQLTRIDENGDEDVRFS